jgi:heme exporter protein D
MTWQIAVAVFFIVTLLVVLTQQGVRIMETLTECRRLLTSLDERAQREENLLDAQRWQDRIDNR